VYEYVATVATGEEMQKGATFNAVVRRYLSAVLNSRLLFEVVTQLNLVHNKMDVNC
jgi:hypothetical protein